MTNEEAKVFLDNLKICIDEHPIVADWLVEIADRKDEPTISKMEQVDEPSGDNLSPVEDEPQTERYCTNCKHNGVIADYECRECNGMDKHEFIEPQTERSE